MCVFELAEDLEAPVLKRKLRPTHRERRRVPRKTGDGACRDSGGGTMGVERIGSDGKPESLSLFRTKRTSRKVPKLYHHVLVLYCCTSVDIFDGRRGKNKKTLI